MGHTVNTDEMSVLCHLLYEILISVDAFAHEEKEDERSDPWPC